MKSKHEQKIFKKEDAKNDDIDLDEAFKKMQVKPQIYVDLPCTSDHDMFLMTPKASDRRNRR